MLPAVFHKKWSLFFSLIIAALCLQVCLSVKGPAVENTLIQNKKPHISLKNRLSASRLYRKGLYYFREHNYRQAISYYLQSLELEPDRPHRLRELAVAYLRFGAVEQNHRAFKLARINLVRAVELEPGFAGNYLYLGDCYLKLDDRHHALEMYRKCLEVGPRSRFAPIARQMINILDDISN